MAEDKRDVAMYPECDPYGTFHADKEPDTQMDLEYNSIKVHLGAVDTLPGLDYDTACRQLEARLYALRSMVQSMARLMKRLEDEYPDLKEQLKADYSLPETIWKQYVQYAEGGLIHGLAVWKLNHRVLKLSISEQRRLLAEDVDVVDPRTREVRKITLEDLASEEARQQMIHSSLPRFQYLKEQWDWLRAKDEEDAKEEAQKPSVKYSGSGNSAELVFTQNGVSIRCKYGELVGYCKKLAANYFGQKVKVIIQKTGIHQSKTSRRGQKKGKGEDTGVLDESDT